MDKVTQQKLEAKQHRICGIEYIKGLQMADELEKDTEVEIIDGLLSPNLKVLIENELVWFEIEGFSKEDLKKYLSQMVDEVFNA